jgi:two-component system sensor histidine kinase AtoS
MRLRDRFDRWMGALVGFALGAFDTALFQVLGTEFSLAGEDVTFLVTGAFTSSLIALGFMLGLTVEMRRRERSSAEALARARDQIAQNEKLASLGQLAGAIAHEVKNPLAIIRSSIQNVGESLAETDGESRESARFAMEEIDRLTRVTNSLLAFARPISIARSKVSCASILHQTEMLAARMLSDRSIALERDAAFDAAIDADADLVCQVLLGLLGNAAEVTPPGGAVRLEGRAGRETVEISVSDRGPGVPAELRERIFEPFFTTRDGGTGLGLAVARQIVEAHQGEIAVEDRAGGGARFTVRLRRVA